MNNGQKRTAFILADHILGDFGYHLNVDKDVAVDALREIASHKCNRKRIEKWVLEKAETLHFG